MFFVIPLQVDDAAVDRIPWVSIAIALLCFAVFVFTWVLPPSTEESDAEDASRIFEALVLHPELNEPAEFEALFDPGGKHVGQAREQMRALPGHAPAAAPGQQEAVDEMAHALVTRIEARPLRRLAFVPRRGARQIGWLSAMFLHFGWLHILGNLLFFYLVGPLLEDGWGRPFFASFYLVGGLAAALAHYSLDTQSATMEGGASGAIAACIGAFTIRHAERPIRMAYYFWFFRMSAGTFVVPAFAWGLFWFGRELLSFWLEGANNGVAVMAHIGGFAFGGIAALALKYSGIEEKYIRPAVEKKVWTVVPELGSAASATARSSDPRARRMARHQAQAELLEQARAAFGRGDRTDGTVKLGAAIEPLLAASDLTRIHALLTELGQGIDLTAIEPKTAFALATALESSPGDFANWVEPLLGAASRAQDRIGVAALLRLVERRLEIGDRSSAEKGLRAARSHPGFAPQLETRLSALEQRVRELGSG
jgi:membrane associated rhomboid family serine protease